MAAADRYISESDVFMVFGSDVVYALYYGVMLLCYVRVFIGVKYICI